VLPLSVLVRVPRTGSSIEGAADGRVGNAVSVLRAVVVNVEHKALSVRLDGNAHDAARRVDNILCNNRRPHCHPVDHREFCHCLARFLCVCLSVFL
jgi:hypothetical protein